VTEQVVVEIGTWPFVTYAMAYNDIPFIDGVRVIGIPSHYRHVTVAVQLIERGRPLTASWSHEIDHDGTGLLEFRPNVVIESAAMSTIEEDRPGQVSVRVSVGDAVLAETVKNLSVRASRHWQFFGEKPELSHELLGSFVMPNDPAVPVLLAEARQLLGERTSSTSTEG
jgi:hypothetical protein